MTDLHTLANAILDGPTKAYALAVADKLEPVAPPPTTGRWFTDTSYLNTRVPANPTISPSSPAWIKLLLSKWTTLYSNGLDGNVFNGAKGAWSSTVYHSAAATPNVQVREARTGKTYIVPMDSSWKPSPGDRHMTVIEPTGQVWEYQGLDVAAKTCQGVCHVTNVKTGDGASSALCYVSDIPAPAGLVRPEEIAAGVIPHALHLISNVWSSQCVYPAAHSDGSTPNGIPMGSRLWLPRSVSLAGLTTYQAMEATALQEYGGYAGDSGGAFTVPFQSTADGVTKYPFASLTLPQSIVSQLKVVA